MNAAQTRYAIARATYETLRDAAAAAYPAQPAVDAGDEAWEAHFEAQESVDARTGLNAARNELFAAEQALIAWGATTKAGKASGLDFNKAAKWLDLRAKLVDICFRAAA
jgi:hypothetical protein